MARSSMRIDAVTSPALSCHGVPRPSAVMPTTRWTPARRIASAYAAPRRDGVVVHNGGGDVFLVGSRFAVDGRRAAMLLRSLPPVVHLEAGDQVALRWSIERMIEERRQDRPGAALVMQHLAHLTLVQALRLHLSRQGEAGRDRRASWFSALSDPQVSAAMGAIHADPAHRWTLAELALSLGYQSKSAFSTAFKRVMGCSPRRYALGQTVPAEG